MKKLIVGLGNPGSRYVFNRHNVGFLCVDRYYELTKKIIDYKSFSFRNYEGFESKEFILVKPLTFMNLSGNIFSDLFQKHGKIMVQDIIVLYDDVSIPFGKIRIKEQGSAGGHNGMKSIIGVLASDNFTRIRIGIGEKPEFMDLADYVLANFSQDEYKSLYQILDGACSAIDFLLQGETSKAMNVFNNKDFLV